MTSTPTPTEVFDLDAAVAAAAAAREAQALALKEKEQHERQARAQDLLTAFTSVIGPEAAAAMTYHVVATKETLGIHIIYLDSHIQVSKAHSYASDGGPWHIEFSTHRYNAAPRQVLPTILTVMADIRASAAEKERLLAEQLARNAANDAFQEEQHQIREAERAAARAEHEEIAAEVAALREAATVWNWPEGLTIRFYHWSWQHGAWLDTDGSLHSERSEGWALFDGPDDAGYITIMPTRWSEERPIKLIPQAHLPFVVRHDFVATTELDDALTEPQYLVIPGIVHDWSDADPSQRLFRRMTEDEISHNEPPYREVLTTQPIAWVRKLIEMTNARGGNH